MKEDSKTPYIDGICWDNPHPDLLFYKFAAFDEQIRMSSALIIGEGQGALLVYKGKVEAVVTEEGVYDIPTCGKPFIGTLKKIAQHADEDRKTGIWFFRTAGIHNCQWSTMSLARYLDPENKYPAIATAFGNYSLCISNATVFFTRIVQGDSFYYQNELRELLMSHITQPMTRLITAAKSASVSIDLDKIAAVSRLEANCIYSEWGFELTNFNIEGPFFSDYALFSMRKKAESDSTHEI